MKKLTQLDFINRANLVHNYKYDYSKVKYKTMKDKVIIVCPIHGEFNQSPSSHLHQKNGCPLCGAKQTAASHKQTQEEFITKVAKLHHGKYNYSKVNYVDMDTYITIICPFHGEFKQSPRNHMKHGCYKCSSVYPLTTEDFINRANLVHNYKYIYSLVEYKNMNEPVIIICPIHGEFSQVAINHLQGNGCPICSSSKGELEIKKYLDKYKINYIQQYCFNDCKYIRLLPFDFYLPDYNICIEYDGEQHFKAIDYFGGEENFVKVRNHDGIKTNFCKQNDIRLIRIPYYEKGNIKNILNKELYIF